MKKFVFIFLLILFILTPCAAVYGEEGVPSENLTGQEQTGEIAPEEPPTEPQKSDLALWWENSIEPYIWQYATALAGAASGIAILIGYIRKIVKALKGSKADYDADLGKAQAKLETAMQDFEKQKAEYLAQIAALQETIEAKVSECVSAVKTEVAGVRADAHKAVEMALVAYTNDKNLVVNGHAKRIAEIARGETPEVEDVNEG